MAAHLKAEIFWDLRRYLKTEKEEMEGMSKKQLQAWYDTHYKTYRQQISPEEKLPAFYTITQAVYKLRLAHFDDDKLTLGPESKKVRAQKKKQGKSRIVQPQERQSDRPAVGTVVRNGQVVTRKFLMNQNRMAVDQHLTFKRGHTRVVDEPGFTGDVTDWKYINRRERCLFCTICRSQITALPDAQRHIEGRKHRLAVAMSVLKSKKGKLVEGCPGVVLSTDCEEREGTYCIDTEPGNVKKIDITVSNSGDSEVELVHCEMMKKVRVFTLRDSKNVTDGMATVILKPGENYKIQVRAQAQHVGTYHCPVMFHIVRRTERTKQNGYVLRYLSCKCKNNLIEELKPTTKYKRPPKVNRAKGQVSEIVPGYKLQFQSGDNLEREIELPLCLVSHNVRKMINRGLTDTHGLTEHEKAEMEYFRDILESDLDMEHYRQRFESMLFFEEVQMEVDIRKYDMENAPLRSYHSNQRLLLLEVPGLSENRPSVLRGDWLFVSYSEGEVSNREYQGFVHEVLQNEVALGFDKRDRFIENQRVNVRFVFNRLPLRLQHRACRLADELSLANILFPSKDSVQSDVKLPELKLYNRDLESNAQQKCAVQHILAGTSRPAPYLVFGPPGTGKTVTIVEAIKQIWKCSSTSRVLACTPSNSAADLIARRLLQHIPKAEIIRLNASSRSWSGVPEEVKCVCNFDKDTRHAYYPRKEEFNKYRIVITTMVTAGRLVSANFPPDHFSHVFIDEAGHAPEPEAVIALAGIMEVNTLMKSPGQVVIAGDPKQLGPILRSPLAIKYGLDRSLLERYMESCDLYAPSEDQAGHRCYNKQVITKLLKNYRSHPAILKLPNEIFYDNELIHCAGIERERLCNWEGLEKQGFPLVFHGVIGEDMREEKSPSFFNPQEVSVVLQYIEDLINYRKGGISLKQSDIGVISPYRKQVQKIKEVLRKKKLDKISVGSVEEFQGQERTVIIVSTVRSKPEYLSFDMQYQLGFLRNPKRFNVTVTRAKALLIVIGNPNTLSGDVCWKQLIDYCVENEAYRGTERLCEEDELEDLIQRLNAVQLIDDEYHLIPEVQSEYNEQAWRSDL